MVVEVAHVEKCEIWYFRCSQLNDLPVGGITAHFGYKSNSKAFFLAYFRFRLLIVSFGCCGRSFKFRLSRWLLAVLCKVIVFGCCGSGVISFFLFVVSFSFFSFSLFFFFLSLISNRINYLFCTKL